ncbi:aldose 1-epimerase [Jannaschia sp. LMIT008]|uniref:aldose 1-epimerase n=1 Tax=Jannaschia maritima TaxID=3032585 RepID=UPI002811BFBC|nr:aldose 1-epimerase [Jannaschia sp. LMIT008]
MTAALTIGDARLRAVVRPDLGGGLARLDRRRGDGWDSVLRPLDGPETLPDAAFAMALNVLVPFSNRLSAGVDGHPVPPNVAGEAYPIHGDGWLSAWDVDAAGEDSASLSHRGAIGPWRYDATLAYTVAAGALTVVLEATNTGEAALPMGLGVHPWFVRRPGTTLQAPARSQWLEGRGHLPTECVPVTDPRAFDAGQPVPLPDAWINAGFEGWTGAATLRWPDAGGVRMDVTGADPPVDRYVLYSPAADAAFVCVEPVTHAIDAPALPGGAAANGMVALAPGDTTRLACRIHPFEEDPT